MEITLAHRYIKGLTQKQKLIEAKKRKALGKYTNEKLEEEMFERKKKKVEIIDLLKNSTLPKSLVIKDLLKFGLDRKLDPSLTLPKRTLECYY